MCLRLQWQLMCYGDRNSEGFKRLTTVVGLGLSLHFLSEAFRAKVNPVHFKAKTFYVYSSADLNPLIDVKNDLLGRYPFRQPEGLVPEEEANTYRIKKAIYDAFLADDTGAIIAIANQLSYVTNSASVSYDIYFDDYVHASYTNFYVGEIVDALDTTVLLTAYLFDRLNLRSAARKYYSTYYQAMRLILLPGMNSEARLLSRRLVAVRVKLRLLLDSPLSREHADSSYVDTLIEMFLQQVLAEHEFTRYRQKHITYPVVGALGYVCG
ncbi:hypothetical protein FXB40_21595 [Bradyrhizobium rifense]|uniref:Uncharacterized protein n=1 Tax=Bradyrhizobium rifense TaxID=515499 RepID=A0A5D3KBH9_9BRAD|nr:hypothetical protein [Bradyrhizobium rifense]TYL93427.1 hypothetical protein FXB40_21595 [Bradyrhizobium rifense]